MRLTDGTETDALQSISIFFFARSRRQAGSQELTAGSAFAWDLSAESPASGFSQLNGFSGYRCGNAGPRSGQRRTNCPCQSRR